MSLRRIRLSARSQKVWLIPIQIGKDVFDWSADTLVRTDCTAFDTRGQRMSALRLYVKPILIWYYKLKTEEMEDSFLSKKT